MKNSVFFATFCIIFGIIIAFASCSGNKPGNAAKPFPQINVEAEEVVYEYTDPRNGSGPFWCYGSSILARDGEDVFVSGIETLYSYVPDEKLKNNYLYHRTINNIRWLLFKRESDGWKLQQADEKDRTREPSPIGLLSDGRLLMSVNPTLDNDSTKPSTLNRPEILEFSVSNPKAPFKTHMPAWEGNPPFSEHSYRTFTVDKGNNEFMLFQNIGYTHSEWAFSDGTGKWVTGKLQWPFYVNDPVTPFNAKQNRVDYPSVVLKNKEVHFFGNSSVNIWSRMQTLDDFKKVGIDNPQGLDGRKIAGGGRTRSLYYTFTPDITKEPFSTWLEVASTFDNGGSMQGSDLWLDPDGVVHLLWTMSPIAAEYRDKYFQDIKRIWAIWYAQIREGKIILKKALLETGEVPGGTTQTDLPDNSTVSFARFQVLPENRLFVIYYVSGRDQEGKLKAENRIMEVYRDGSVSKSTLIPLKYPMSFFFTATPRGGSMPSEIIDLVGRQAGPTGNDQKPMVRYARIKMTKK